MELLADRFAVLDGARVVDLATAEMVTVRVGAAGNRGDRDRWEVRCHALYDLVHPAVARLVDYGAMGSDRRFEAWRWEQGWRGGRRAAERASRQACELIDACELTVGGIGLASVGHVGGGAVVLPEADTGYELQRVLPTGESRQGLKAFGLVRGEIAGVGAVAEVFERPDGSRPRVVALWGAPGCGKSTAVAALACVARRHGFVAIAAGLLGRSHGLRDVVLEAVRGRTLFLIDDEDHRGWEALGVASAKSPRPHVLLIVRQEAPDGVDGIGLTPVPAERLRAAVRPANLPAVVRRRIDRAANLSAGCPGQFVRALWRPVPALARYPEHAAADAGLRAAEETAPYGAAVAADRTSPAAGDWSIGGRLDTARRLMERGRHAAGERLLRQVGGASLRRAAWRPAADCGLALATHLLSRGRPAEARAALEDVADWIVRSRDTDLLVEAEVLTAAAWHDLGRADEAEALAAAALAAARAQRRADRAARAALGLAQCLFWRGRFVEAGSVLKALDADALDSATGARLCATVAGVSVACGDLDRAVAVSAEAVARAGRSDDASVMAMALGGRAFVRLALGDLESVVRDGAEAVRVARVARQPLTALDARLVIGEAERRAGRIGDARTAVRRAHRCVRRGVPFTIAARANLLRDLLAPSVDPGQVVERHVRATGLAALRLFVPGGAAGAPFSPALVREVVDILQVCQTAEEDVVLLQQICARLRLQLRAAAVAFVAAAESGTIASDGGRVDRAAADRAIDAGVTVGPHPCVAGTEAAAPVRYGGSLIGALVARWSLGTSSDASPASAVLTMGATAAAPALAAALARRASRTPPEARELIGVSAAMCEVRRAVEQAAGVPFPVLIVGESGSGKELVARALHRLSPHRERRWSVVNCAALPDDLVEAELFGHARGAFTGAMADRAGVFEEANGGTLFLDEIGELSLRAQAKVLRVVQEGELRRVGENTTRRVEVRLVAATNRDLQVDAAGGRFRLDLLYRLDVIRIQLPPLRERREDIVCLVDHFWRDASARVGSQAMLAAATVGALARYDWPGNAREVQNVLAALAVRSPRRGVVPPTALPPFVAGSAGGDACRLDEARRSFDERFVRAALVRAGGHRGRAASELGLSRQGLTKLMIRLGIVGGHAS